MSLVETFRPIADGDLTQWNTLQSGTDHFAMVDDEFSDEDGTYILETSPSGEIDVFTYPSVSGVIGFNVTIENIIPSFRYRKDSGVGMAQARPVLRIGGSNFFGATVNQGLAYATFTETFLTNPSTGQPWTVVELDSLQAGLATIFLSLTDPRWTQYSFDVTYHHNQKLEILRRRRRG